MLGWMLLAMMPQVAGAQQAELYVGCPVGAVLETAADPRPGPLTATPVARVVVRCVTQRALDTLPQCNAANMRPIVSAGPDRCGTAMAVTDGTSNTIMVGEASRASGPRTTMGDGSVRTTGTVSDGTSNTIMVGERAPAAPATGSGKASGNLAAAPVPSCPPGSQIAIDGGSFGADICVTRSFAPPGEPVSVVRR